MEAPPTVLRRGARPEQQQSNVGWSTPAPALHAFVPTLPAGWRLSRLGQRRALAIARHSSADRSTAHQGAAATSPGFPVLLAMRFGLPSDASFIDSAWPLLIRIPGRKTLFLTTSTTPCRQGNNDCLRQSGQANESEKAPNRSSNAAQPD